MENLLLFALSTLTMKNVICSLTIWLTTTLIFADGFMKTMGFFFPRGGGTPSHLVRDYKMYLAEVGQPERRG
jgi:hypothetical protein